MATNTRSFEFEEGDWVRVRVRENGTRGNIIAKFEGRCKSIFNDREGTLHTPRARISLPWGVFNSVTLRPYEAEFEVLD